MRITDMFIYSIKYLRTQKLRSWLTIVGIVIGVATIVSLVSIGDGIKNKISDELSVLGNDILIVVPVNVENMGGFSTNIGTVNKLYERDYEKIVATPGIKMTGRMLMGKTYVQFKEKSITTQVRATDASTLEMWSEFFKVENGRRFNDNERGVVVVGYDAANELFGKDKLRVNSIIKIGGKDFRVVGILSKVGSSFSSNDDLAFYIPLRDGRELFKSTILPNEITLIYAKVEPDYDPNLIKARIETQIDANHHVSEDERDYSVITSEYIMKKIDQIVGTLALFLLLISSVSAIVGGIGISNTMFMSVLDRTHEIGIMKSFGAKTRDIMMLFIIEAIIIGLIGGLLGCLIGVGISEIIKEFGIFSSVNPIFLIIVILCSMVVGAVAGAIPAYRASKIPPIEAINY